MGKHVLVEAEIERMSAFEDLIIALYKIKDSNDKHILLPGLSELVNIYQQAENK